MIDKDSFVMYAMRAYDKPSCKTIGEFEEDLSKFSLLIRLCGKDVDEELPLSILNMVTSLLNVFEHETCIKMMFFKVKKENWNKLKTVLVYMDRMPEEIQELQLRNSEIEICQSMVRTLREI